MFCIMTIFNNDYKTKQKLTYPCSQYNPILSLLLYSYYGMTNIISPVSNSIIFFNNQKSRYLLTRSDLNVINEGGTTMFRRLNS